MKQDVGFFDVGTNCPDIVIENGDLKPDNTLETAALISVFSDRRVETQDLPQGINDPKGWWADAVSDPENDLIGSRLWTLIRQGKVLEETVSELENLLIEAFQWTIRDGIASSVEVSAQRVDSNEIRGSVNIIKPTGEDIPFSFVWEGQRLKLIGQG